MYCNISHRNNLCSAQLTVEYLFILNSKLLLILYICNITTRFMCIAYQTCRRAVVQSVRVYSRVCASYSSIIPSVRLLKAYDEK